MLIFIEGSDSFLAREAINKIKAKYLEKNPGGAELIEIDETTSEPNPSTSLGVNWADLLTVPLFATSRLIIVRRLGYFPPTVHQQLSLVLGQVPESTVVVVWDARPVKDTALEKQLAAASKTIGATTPQGAALSRWLTARARELGFELSRDQLQELQQRGHNELWELETELQTLSTGLSSATVREAASEPFVFFNLVRRNNWEAVKKELAKKARQGEPVELVVGSLAAACRKELRDEDQLRELVGLLIDIDLGLKTGSLDPDSAIALMIAHLPQPLSNRVQWENTWGEIAS
ncbi:MAG: hypothetical protein HZB70_02940 [Candidatus Berkelbacteria bacterium]|nr:MAG: hypothetical protein HZB70_02940 [Candidatus Berkelbacteria bacterium]QQG51739.1 MAG: hypothetical protein HY845_00055 [Candidatus Berkelbacteria bacterium]